MTAKDEETRGRLDHKPRHAPRRMDLYVSNEPQPVSRLWAILGPGAAAQGSFVAQ